MEGLVAVHQILCRQLALDLLGRLVANVVLLLLLLLNLKVLLKVLLFRRWVEVWLLHLLLLLSKALWIMVLLLVRHILFIIRGTLVKKMKVVRSSVRI